MIPSLRVVSNFFFQLNQAAGKAVPSLASTLIEQGVHKKHGDAIVMNISATIFGAGADTVCFLLHFNSLFLLISGIPKHDPLDCYRVSDVLSRHGAQSRCVQAYTSRDR